MSEPNIQTKPDARLTRWLRKHSKRGSKPYGREALWASKDQSSATSRLISLDVFRGITIAGMVLVNNPGSWAHIYWPLEHAEWNGWTPTDLIFPFFLFIVVVAIPLALGRRVDEGGSRRGLYWKII